MWPPMKGEVDLDAHHARCPSCQDLVFYSPALSHLASPGAFRSNRCLENSRPLSVGMGRSLPRRRARTSTRCSSLFLPRCRVGASTRRSFLRVWAAVCTPARLNCDASLASLGPRVSYRTGCAEEVGDSMGDFVGDSVGNARSSGKKPWLFKASPLCLMRRRTLLCSHAAQLYCQIQL